MIRIKSDRSWKRQLKITLKGYLKFRGYWFYSISLVVISLLIRIFLYQNFSDLLRSVFFPAISLFLIFPCLLLEIYGLFRKSCFKGEGDVWVFVDDNGFGSESDFVKVSYQWNQVDTISEEQDMFRFTKKGKFCFAFDKYNLSKETLLALKGLFLKVPVENVKLLD